METKAKNFMKVKYSNLLTKLANIVGVTGVSLLIGLPIRANEVLNPNLSVFNEAPYNNSQRVLIDSHYTPNTLETETTKSTKTTTTKNVVAQSGSSRTNPSPRILQECPYNRAACPGGGTSSPSNTSPDTTTPPDLPVTPTPPDVPTPSKPETPSSGSTDGKNIVAIAESSGSFKTLTQALKAAGLVETLQGKGPFTVFAPTDAAFAELPQDAVADLLKPENKEVLVKILTYHVVPGALQSSSLKPGEVKSVEGGAINVKVSKGGVVVNDAKVVQADIKASNGVIHAIDKVILPPDL